MLLESLVDKRLLQTLNDRAASLHSGLRDARRKKKILEECKLIEAELLMERERIKPHKKKSEGDD